ncbi:MAG: aminotransferase class IV [Phycisphaerales bacterium]|nr:aminotransferase class IV [Phycisphaerales bacterium]
MADRMIPRMTWLNGELMPTEEVRISPFDRGFLFGDGVYEMVRVFGGVPIAMGAHEHRLAESLRATRITGFTANSYTSIVNQLLAEEQLVDATVYLQVTRGADINRQHLPTPGVPPTVFAFALPAPSVEDLDSLSCTRVILKPDERWQHCEIKAIGLLPNVLAMMQADQHGASEAILHRHGLVSEGTHSNLLIAMDGVLATPPTHAAPTILDGTMRRMALQAAREIGVPVQERPLHVDELHNAGEIALTSSRKILHAVSHVDDRPVGRPEEENPIMTKVFTRMRDSIVASMKETADHAAT